MGEHSKTAVTSNIISKLNSLKNCSINEISSNPRRIDFLPSHMYVLTYMCTYYMYLLVLPHIS